MNIQNRLENIPTQVKQALQPSFIFLINEDIIQHFPIRQWQAGQILAEIQRQLGPNYESSSWHNYLICWNVQKTKLLIIPRYQTITSLENESDSH